MSTAPGDATAPRGVVGGAPAPDRGGRRPPEKRRRPEKTSRHRPRTANRGGEGAREDRRFYADGTPVDPDDAVEPPSGPAGKRRRKENSSFFVLHRSMTSAEAVAQFVRDNVKEFNDVKGINMFTQALSNRPDDFFAAFFGTFRSEAAFLLDRVYSLLSSGKVAVTPSVHEFIIRCAQHGLRKAEWAAGVEPLGKGQQPLLYSPRDILKKMASVDPVGHVNRQLELSTEPSHLLRVLRKSADLFERDSPSTPFKVQAQVLSKAVSKLRRLADRSVKDKAGDGEGDESSVQEGGERAAAAAAAPSALSPLPEDEQEALKEAAAELFALMQSVTAERPMAEAQPLLTKFLRFGEWCGSASLFRSDADARMVEELDARVQAALRGQQSQIEAVLQLRSTQKDTAALDEMLGRLWDEEKGVLEPHSADVLSSLATAANRDEIDAELKKRVVKCLLKTVKHCDGLVLPRRAQKLVTDVMHAKKQEEIKKKLESA